MNRLCTLCVTVLAGLLISANVQADDAAKGATVVPIDWSRFKGMQGFDPKDEIGSKLTKILQNQSRYMLNWMASDHEIKSDIPEFKGIPCYYPAFKNGFEQSVRPLSHISWGTAMIIRTGIYSPEVAGISEEDAIKRTELAIRGDAFTHKVNRTSGTKEERWGDDWQSAYWSSEIAEAAWLLWDKLSPETQIAVTKMTAYEADRFIDYKVPYFGNKAGKVTRPGNTAGEENAWNSRILMAAICMMPNHPHQEAWHKKACELMMSSYARPQDLTVETIIDGKPVKDWLNGFNALDNGMVVNHGRVHPDYTACIFEKCTAVVDCSFANVPVPQSAFYNLDTAYGALTSLKFTPGPSPWTKHQILPPGGTVLHRNPDGSYDPAAYYPEGADWTNVAYDNLILDIYAKMRHLDDGKDFKCEGWIIARLDAILAQQARPDHDGNIYGPKDWLTEYRNTDAVSYQSLSEAWSVWWLMQHKMVSPDAGAH